jgi:predicted NBD/HSP70 family sugar kinase
LANESNAPDRGQQVTYREGTEQAAGSGSVERQYSIGVRVTATQLIGLLVDLDGKVVDLKARAAGSDTPGKVVRRRNLPGIGVDQVVSGVAGLVAELLTIRSEFKERAIGLGVSIGGHVDGVTGEVRYSPHFGWEQRIPLAEHLRRATGLSRVVLENDVNALANAQRWFGRGENYRLFAVVKIGSGIGCGLFIKTELERGKSGLAGELGHIPLEPVGELCKCGKRGCLQTVAGGDGIVRALQRQGRSPVDSIEAAAALVRGGDRRARLVFERAGEALGLGLATLLNLLNLEAIVLCGEVAVLGSGVYVDSARRSLASRAFSTAADDCDLWVEERTDELEARGAASMVFDDLLAMRERERTAEA